MMAAMPPDAMSAMGPEMMAAMPRKQCRVGCGYDAMPPEQCQLWP
ncbi:MAG: hypothetical protein CM15mP62_13270 [Rhodospirillaceae bacterium]|nr:MAG: hypothetical protein CM15mP62_13270 [Rhodospirillaceae bacterium]